MKLIILCERSRKEACLPYFEISAPLTLNVGPRRFGLSFLRKPRAKPQKAPLTFQSDLGVPGGRGFKKDTRASPELAGHLLLEPPAFRLLRFSLSALLRQCNDVRCVEF